MMEQAVEKSKVKINKFESKNIAIIAGSGALPLLCIKKLKQDGAKVYVFAIKNQDNSQELKKLKKYSNEFCEIHLGKFGKLLKLLKKNDIELATMVGAINKANLFSLLAFDYKALSIIKRLKTTGDDTILKAVAAELKSIGIQIIGASEIVPEILIPKGLLTKRDLSAQEKKDAEIGIAAIEVLGKLDVGQALTVNKGTILAIEGVEGTDNLIKRSSDLINIKHKKGSPDGIVVVKFSKPNQDLRLDLPTVGPKTIETLINSKASAIVLQSGKSQMLSPNETISLANANGICILSV